MLNDIYFSAPESFSLELQGKLNKYKDRKIFVFSEIDSTNTFLKRNFDLPNRSIALSHVQSGGKGRKGRSFLSQKGGLYLSVSVKDNIPDVAFRLCAVSAVCVCETLRELFNVNAKIKWINDIQIDGKKVCGILCESVFSGDTPVLSVAGIGINIYKTDMPSDLIDIVTTVNDHSEIKYSFSEIVSNILNRFDTLLDRVIYDGDFSYVLRKYRGLSAVIGKKISFTIQNKETIGTAVSIADDGKLEVLDDNGKTHMLDNADVSIKIK